MGARTEVNDVVHSYGGIVLHDVINDTFARKAIEKGADGLIAVAAGAGGHGGVQSPFALVQEIRRWFDGALVLAGSIARGDSIVAALAMGADLAYIGSAFIATDEANPSHASKQMTIDCSAQDIVYTSYFTGVHANFLMPSVAASGIHPDSLRMLECNPSEPGNDRPQRPKAWSEIWGAGQGVGAVHGIQPAAQFVERLNVEYKRRLAEMAALARLESIGPT